MSGTVSYILHEELVLQSELLVVSRQLSAQDQYKTANVTTTSMPTMLIHKQVYTHTARTHAHCLYISEALNHKDKTHTQTAISLVNATVTLTG